MSTSSPPHSRADAAIGFDPARRAWVTSGQTGSGVAPLPALDGELLTTPRLLEEMADDFGHMVSHRPSAVLRPGSAEDIARMVRFARQHQLKIAPRGNGHTLYGQAQVEAGIIIDMRAMSRIHSIQGDRAVVEAGITWGRLVDQTMPQGLTPPVLPDYLDLTVGGTLSVGGLADNSFQFGAQVDNVLELEVVTGEGEQVACSLSQHRELFEALLPGLGQCGIIVKATVKLIPIPKLLRMFDLGYPAIGPLLRDMLRGLNEGRFDHATAFAAPDPTGKWMFRMHLAVNHPPSSPPDNARLLEGFSYERGSEQILDLTYPQWVHRIEPIMGEAEKLGLYTHPHPWCDLFVPASKVEELCNAVIKESPVDHFPLAFPILMFPLKRERMTRRQMPVPTEDTFFLFDVLRDVTPGKTDIAQVIAHNRKFYERNQNWGGTQYTISGLQRSSEDWKRHFGAAWESFASAKRRYDPDNVLTPGPGIFR